MFVAPAARGVLRWAHRARFFDEVVEPMIDHAVTIGVDLEVLVTTRLGPTRSDTGYGELDHQHQRRAADLGLSLDPVPLQDLFVHLTEPTDRAYVHAGTGRGNRR